MARDSGMQPVGALHRSGLPQPKNIPHDDQLRIVAVLLQFLEEDRQLRLKLALIEGAAATDMQVADEKVLLRHCYNVSLSEAGP